MMKKTIFFVCGAAALLLAGCAKAPEEKAPQGRVVTISASIDSDDETKATVGNDGSFTWASGDQIGVWTSLGKFVSFSLKSGESGKSSAAFEGTLSDGETIIGPAVYPYRAGHSYNPATGELTYNQGSADDWTANTTKSHMAAKYDGGDNFSFRHLDGLLRITVYNLPPEAARIRIIAPDKAINGNFAVDMNAESPVISAPSGSNSRIDMKLNDKNTGEVGLGFVVNYPLPVGDYTNMTFAILDSEQNEIAGYSKTISSLSITRKKMVNMPEVTLNAVDLADNESGLRDNFNKVDYTTDYTGSITTDATIEVVSNPKKTVMNASNNVLKVTSTASGGYSGLIDILTKGAFTSAPVAYYPSGYRDGTKAFTVKMLYADPADASKYYPWGQCKSTQAEMVHPDRVNGSPYDGTAEKWAELIKPGDWNVLQWTCNNSGTYRIDIKPFLNNSGGNQISDAARIIYFDDFRFLK